MVLQGTGRPTTTTGVSLGLDDKLTPRATLTVRAKGQDGKTAGFKVLARIDTPEEMSYYRHGGILPYVLRQLVAG